LDNTAFLITVRLKSTRLPKKVLLEVMGKPFIVHMLDRIKSAETINKIIICTSTNRQDNPIEKIAIQEDVICYRGSENDVLKRLLGAAKKYSLPFFVNVTADCPLVDPMLVDRIVKEHIIEKADFTMYAKEQENLPFDCCVIQTDILDKVVQSKITSDTEVWLKYFKSDNSIKIHNIDPGRQYYHNSLKTSLDYPEDYEFMKRLFSEFYNSHKIFSLLDIIKLVKKNPEILDINANPELLNRWRDHQHKVA